MNRRIRLLGMATTGAVIALNPLSLRSQPAGDTIIPERGTTDAGATKLSTDGRVVISTEPPVKTGRYAGALGFVQALAGSDVGKGHSSRQAARFEPVSPRTWARAGAAWSHATSSSPASLGTELPEDPNSGLATLADIAVQAWHTSQGDGEEELTELMEDWNYARSEMSEDEYKRALSELRACAEDSECWADLVGE